LKNVPSVAPDCQNAVMRTFGRAPSSWAKKSLSLSSTSNTLNASAPAPGNA
jgi:hypothetical protein